jgi:hypothetical protein
LPFAGSFFYVDPVNGDNANPPGNPNLPWKTLTFALCVTGPGKTIRALPGTYSVATNGEAFPLVVRGQRVDSATSRAAVIEGVGLVSGDTVQASVDMQMSTSTSRLNGFKLTGSVSNHGVGVLLRDGTGTATALLQDLEVTGHDTGVLVEGTTPNADFLLSSLVGNQVNFQASGASVVRVQSVSMQVGLTNFKATDTANVNLRFSAITNAGSQNVEVSSPNVDLGRVGSTGSNSFQGAAGVNLWNKTTGTLTAVGNTLDARPVTQSNTDENDGGQNVANEFSPLGCTKVQASDCP